MIFPARWSEVLTKLREAGGTDAVIAGGAVRDFLLGRPVKDIDVFMGSRGKAEDKRLVTSVFPDAVCQAEHLDEYLPQFQELSSIWHVPGKSNDFLSLIGDDDLETIPVQVMFLNADEPLSPEYIVDRIDIGLCRVGFDGERIVADPGFVQDVLTQTMTVRRRQSPENHERSRKRYERLSVKYPNYTFSTPYN